MAIALGNATQHGYNAQEGPPGWETNIWMGAAIIDGNPARDWAILDNKDQPLIVPAASRIADVGFGIYGDLLGTDGDRIKFGATAADTAGYIVNSLPFASSMLPAADYQLLLQPWASVLVASQFTPKLWLHTNNVASVNTAKAATLTPATQIVPALFPTQPVIVQVRVTYLTPTGGPKKSDPLYLSESQQRKFAGLPDLA